MPTIDNPYRSPLAAPLTTLSKAFMSGPSEAQNIYLAEKAVAAKRENDNTPVLAEAFRQFGMPGFDRNKAMAAAVAAGYSPQNLANLERYGAANTFGVSDPRTSNAFVGAGGSFGSSPQGTREAEANQTTRTQMALDQRNYEFNNKPFVVGTDTGPVVVRQSESYGKPAVEDLGKVKGNAARVAMNQPGGLAAADPTTKVFVGAEKQHQQTPRNYLAPNGAMFQTYDGVTDARTGQSLPPGGAIAGVQGTPDQSGLRPTVQGKLQEQDISLKRFGALLDHTRQLAQQDSTNFGVTGFVKGVVQDTGQLAQNVATGLGYNGIEDAVVAMRKKAAENGISPGLLTGAFDPNLPALETASDLLVYSAAEALAGQAGRSVSDKDVKFFRDIVGNPRDWMMSQERYLAKLGTIEQILSINNNVVKNALRPGVPSAPAAPAAPGAPVPPPPAPGAPPAVEEWGRGPDGSIQRVR